MVKIIKFEQVSPVEGRIEYPRSSISGYGMYAVWDMVGRIWSKVAYNGATVVIVPRYYSLGPYFYLY